MPHLLTGSLLASLILPLWVWQLEHGRELSALKEKVDVAQETGVANCVLDNQMAQGLATLDGCVEVLERQGRFLLDHQE